MRRAENESRLEPYLVVMGYDAYPSFKNEPFYDFCLRNWSMLALCDREAVVGEFFDVTDGVLYVAARTGENVSAFVLVDKGESVRQGGEVSRAAKHMGEEERPIYAHPPMWFLALLKGPEPTLDIEVSGPTWRETAEANAKWRGVILQRLKDAGPGSEVEFRSGNGMWLADIDGQGILVPRAGFAWPGLAAVVHGVARGGAFIVRATKS